ncbi:MAG: ankyrin repeat domain-containing protein [Treponema sp.]|nr:ankyrin repeat domain-containing protein [Treponema sp.]
MKSLLADDHNRGWQAVEPTSTDDPAHRIPPDKASALVFAACYSRDAGVIDALIAAGARADDSGGLSPLMYAAQYNPDPAILDALIAAGAGVRKDLGYSMLARPALTYAAQYNADPAVVADLIAKGAAVNAKVSVLDNMGFTPLMYAAQYNENPAVIRELVKDGAVVDLADAMGRTALVFAARYNPKVQVLKALLDAGASVNIVGRDYYNVGFTPLMYAAVSDQSPLDKLRMLLDAGADARVRSREGRTALDYAAANDSVAKGSQVYRRLEKATR